MELYVADDDFCAKKVLALSAYSDLKLKIKKGVSAEELLKLHPRAVSMVLQTPNGYITQHNTILRYLADLCPASYLTGVSDFHAAQVIKYLIILTNLTVSQQNIIY
jgi:hypothetical protein